MSEKKSWSLPGMACLTFKEIQEETKKSKAYGATIEGGCWFSHVGGIGEMEDSYGRRSRETKPELPEPKI